MKSLPLRILIACSVFALLLGVSLANDGVSEDPDTVVIYRDESGTLPPISKRAVSMLQRAAASNGFVELWLYLDTDAVDDHYGRACENILQRLVKAGHVQHPTSGPFNQGPVCFVRASERGVAILAKERRFEQVMGSTHSH